MNGWSFFAILVVAAVAESIVCNIPNIFRMKYLAALATEEPEKKEEDKD